MPNDVEPQDDGMGGLIGDTLSLIGDGFTPLGAVIRATQRMCESPELIPDWTPEQQAEIVSNARRAIQNGR